MQKRKSLKRKVGIFNKRRKDFNKRSVPYSCIITLKDHNGETKNYNIIIEYEQKSPNEIDKRMRRIYNLYKIRKYSTNNLWRIIEPQIIQNISRLSKLINTNITITNGKDTISGKVMNASYVGGGSTNPPAPGLPPNDEH